MAHNSSHDFVCASDGQNIQAIIRFSEAWKRRPTQIKAVMPGPGSGNDRPTTVKIPADESPVIDAINSSRILRGALENSVRLFTRIIVDFGDNLSLVVKRQTDKWTDGVDLSSSSLSAEDFDHAVLLANLAFCSPEREASFPDVPPAARSVMEMEHAAIQQLRQLLTDFVGQQIANQQTLDKLQLEHRDKIDSEIEARRVKLEEQYAAKLEELEKREEELDAASARDARRKVYDKLQERFEADRSKFQLSEDTRRKRWPVLIAAAVVFVVFVAGIAALGTAEFSSTAPADTASKVLLWTRQGLLFAGLAAVAVFTLRWLTTWADKHASEEFLLRKLELDYSRAAWFTEMALEWKQEAGEIPPDLVADRMTAGLFVHGDDYVSPEHPAAEAMLKLLGTSAAIELDLLGNKVKLDRKSMRNLKKQEE